MLTAARVISVLLHPLFMPVLVLGMVLKADPHVAFFLPGDQRYVLLLLVTVLTVAFPLVSILLLLRSKVIGSLEMRSRQERIVPFLMVAIYYGMTYFVLRTTHLHPMALSIFTGIIVALVITIAITIRWKISIHMVGVGGAIGAVAGASAVHSLHLLPLISILILLAGILGTARLLLGGHVPAQIYAGAFLGWLAVYSCVVFGVVL